ncbi:MAK10-like protein [Tanacetum coccineum]
MGGSYYPIPCSILSTGKNRKTLQRYIDVPTTSWIIFIRSLDSFQGLTLKSPSSWHRSLASNLNLFMICLAPQALRTTFEARVRDYIAAYTKRMERFENTIFKQREEINSRMTEMFRLLKELTTSRTPEKVLIREEAKFPFTRDLKQVKALIDQGSNVNVMPYSTYKRLIDERPAETDTRLSLASHSYIYPLGIAKDVLVEVAEHVYLVDFVDFDIKENESVPSS